MQIRAHKTSDHLSFHGEKNTLHQIPVTRYFIASNIQFQ